MVKTSETTLVSWEAEEYVQRSKNTGWYIGLVAVGLVFSVFACLLQWWTFLVVIVVSVVALIIYSIRPPRTLHYKLTPKKIMIEEKTYEYAQFKSFGVSNSEGIFSIVLIPRKRFAPRLTMIIPKDQGEKIVDVFGVRLPMKEVKPDFLDAIVKFLRI